MTAIACLLTRPTRQEPLYDDYPWGASVGLPIYALQSTDLSAFACLVITTAADQRHLQRCRPQLQHYLHTGGRIAFNGHVAYPFLDELQAFEPSTEKGLAGLQVRNLHTHPIWAGVADADLSFRKGVAGFYGRGFNPPPAGACIATTLGTREALPLDWIYPVPGGGELLVHAGNDLISFGGAPSTAGLRAAFFRWAAGVPPLSNAPQ